MKTTVRVHIQVSTQGKGEYSTNTIVDRDICIVCPPGTDPMFELDKMLEKEMNTTKHYFDQFPQQGLLTNKDSDDGK